MHEIDILIRDLEAASTAVDLEVLNRIDARVRPVVDALMEKVADGEVERRQATRAIERLLELHLELGQKVATLRREAAMAMRQARSEKNAAVGYLDTQKLK